MQYNRLRNTQTNNQSNKENNMDNAIIADDLKQKADDPTYAGVLSFMRRKYTKEIKNADVVIMGVPFDAAVSNRPGTRFGPQAIRRASVSLDNDPQYPFQSRLFDDMNVIDYGDCMFDYGNHQKTPEAIYNQTKKIINETNNPYLLSLGGDHYVSYPILKAHAEKFGPLAIVQFDAHQDTWDDNGNRIDHGTMIKRAVKEGIIMPENSIQIGIRTVAPDTCGIKIIDAIKTHEMKNEEIVKEIMQTTKNAKVYLTFDIDCLDPAFAPGTGTPVAGGMSSVQALAILHKLKELDVVGSDVVEVAPPYDHSDITAIAGATVAMYMIGMLWERKFKNEK